MKLTDDLLTQMVNEELDRVDERLNVSFQGPADPHYSDSSEVSTKYNAIKSLLKISGKGSKFAAAGKGKADQLKALQKLIDLANKDELTLDDEDVQQAKPGTNEYESLITIAKYTSNKSFAKAIRDAIQKAHGGGKSPKTGRSGKVGAQGDDSTFDIGDAKSFTYPRVMNSDATLGAGKFLNSQNALIKSVFQGNTISSRLQNFSNVSKSIWENRRGDSLKRSDNARETLQKIMFLDMVNFYVNEQDSRSGGYAFEALCAMLCGGKVIGGSNGVADFETAAGTKGSTKFYSNYQNIGQAAANFKKGEPVHYVIGLLDKLKISEEDDSEIQSDKKVSNIKLYYVICTLVGLKGNVGVFHTSDSDGNLLSIQEIEMKAGNKVDVVKGTSSTQSEIGNLMLYSGPTTSFKERVEKVMNERTDDVKKAFDAMKIFFSEMAKTEQQTKTYIASSDKDPDSILDTGNAALSGYDSANKQLVDILELLSPNKKKVSDTGGKRELTENEKLTEELLDKFLKAVIL